MTALDWFYSYLSERENDDMNRYITECILDSVSPIVRIDYHNGIILTVNSDDYPLNDIFMMCHDYGNEASVFIDGIDITDPLF